MKKYYFLVMALAALMSCSSDEFVGDSGSPNGVNGSENAAISFGFDVPQVTRAGGATAAGHLSNQFIVYGEKSEAASGAAASAGNLVFKNYLVKYTDNTAYTTTSNTKNWEYVGISATSAENTNITPNSGTDAQTIKYWDYSASNYVYTAVSALPEDIQNGRVKIEKITDASSTASNQVYNKGYIIKLDKTGESAPFNYASFDKLYFSDRQVISQGTGADRTATNAYGGNVTLTFRNALSQVRVGIYETISGYSISDIHFFVTSDTEAKVDAVDAFGAICPNIKSSTYTEALKVTYEPSGDVVNHPIVTPVTKANTEAVTPTADLILGTNTSLVAIDNPLGTTTTSPTWDTSGGTFTPVFPQAGNTTNLKLKCNYTLYNSVSGETIGVTGATAEIPAQYLQWKPNFRYTYLFKISENTNGTTGTTGPAGLYPITFDAIEVIAADGNVEYITTVSEPSITTFGAIYNTSETKYTAYQTGKNEYQAQTGSNRLDIFATIMDGSTVQVPVEGTNVNYYSIDYKSGATEDDKIAFPITEASVAETIAETANSSSHMIVATKDNSLGEPVTSVPAEDGTTKDINAVKFEGLNAGVYAIEYIKTPATYNNNGGSSFTIASETDFNTEVSSNGKIYTNTDCTTELTWATYSADESSRTATYYRRTTVKNVGVYAYKVIRVQ